MDKFDDLPQDTAQFSGSEKKDEDVSEEVNSVEDTFENTLDMLKSKDRIIRYHISFGRYLSIFEDRISRLDELSNDQLKRLLKEIEIAVSSRTSGNMIKIYYNNAITSVERVAPIVGWNLAGLSRILCENSQVNECLEELNIKYDVMHHVGPEVRLGFITLNAILALNSQNKKLSTIAKVLDDKVKDEHVKQFEDL